MIALTDGIGAIAERYAYSAYGEPVFTNASGTVLADSAKDNRYTYTGREWDEELSLYHFRARMYDPESGRFCGRDPIGYVDGTNLLSSYFAEKGTDPTGESLLASDLENEIKGCKELCYSKYYDAGGWPLFNHLNEDDRRDQYSNCMAKCDEKRTEIPNLPNDPIDTAEDMVCAVFIVFDFVTIPSGEGAAGCLATKGVFRVIKKCFKKPPKPRRPPTGPKKPRPPKKRPPNRTCKAHFTACLGSTIADLDGGVYGETQCAWCRDQCVKQRNNRPGSFFDPISGRFKRCDYWSPRFGGPDL